MLVAVASGGEVNVLDDFEAGVINWDGPYVGAISQEYATHGAHSLKVLFQAGAQYPGINAAKIDFDWSGCDTLKLDVFNPQAEPVSVTVRIDDLESTGYASRYNGEFLLVNGQTFLEVPLAGVTASDRPLDFSRLKAFMIFMASPRRDTVLYFDNFRLTKGPEGDDTRGRKIALADDSPEVARLAETARDATNRLQALIAVAHKSGIGTLEANIALVTAELGLDVRPSLPWFASRKAELYAYVLDSCNAAYRALEATLEGKRVVAPYPPIYDTAGLKFDGPFLMETGPGTDRRPVLLFSMLYHGQGPLCEYFSPIGYSVYTHSFAGASRYDVERTPLYQAYHQYPDTHRVWNGDEGWCGHIVRDSASLGGGREPVVVCLESARTREAIAQYIRQKAPSWKDDPRIRLNIMGGELSYICYCNESLKMFREYLGSRHGEISALNDLWGTKYRSFDDVDVMPNAGQAGENRARWYDWQEFNCRRFVEHAKWAKSVIREVSPDVPVAVGAVTYSLRSSFGRSGVDEENLIREVDDVVLNESGPSTITTDLLWSLSEGARPMVDFEYHGDVAGILPHFLHGNAAMAMWWWPTEVDTEFPQFNETALPYSWSIPLCDVAECLKIALDVRRIAPEIVAFPKQPAEIAILYSRASMLQVDPRFLGGTETPYTIALKDAYDAALGLDAPVRFSSSAQVREGKLAGYRVLVVPAATYAYDDEVEAIFRFAQEGGAVVVIPNSFMFDQYARPRGYLDRLGISITKIVEPDYTAGALARDDFLQGMISATVMTGMPRAEMRFEDSDLLASGTALEAAGAVQTLSVSPGGKVMAVMAGGEPGVVDIPCGDGRFYYLAAPLVPESMNAFLDAVARRAGVDRPVRFALVGGGRDWRIEARYVDAGHVGVFYVTNHGDAPVQVRPSFPFEAEGLIDLRDPPAKMDPSSIAVPARRTGIFGVRKKGARR